MAENRFLRLTEENTSIFKQGLTVASDSLATMLIALTHEPESGMKHNFQLCVLLDSSVVGLLSC